MPNGISRPYQLDEAISNLGFLCSNLQFYSHYKSIFSKQREPDQMLHSAASNLFSCKMSVIGAENHKMLVRIANRED